MARPRFKKARRAKQEDGITITDEFLAAVKGQQTKLDAQTARIRSHGTFWQRLGRFQFEWQASWRHSLRAMQKLILKWWRG